MNAAQIRTLLSQNAEHLADLLERRTAFGPRFAAGYDAQIAAVEAHTALWTELLAKQVAVETAAVRS